MRKWMSLAAVAVMGLGMSGCPLFMKFQPEVRVVHASPDAPNVDVCVDGAVAFADVPFNTSTMYAAVPQGDRALNVTAAGAGCDTAGVIEATLPFEFKTDTTIVAVDLLSNISPLVLEDDNSTPPDGFARVRFVNASPGVAPWDLRNAMGTILADDVEALTAGDYIEVPAQAYNLSITNPDGSVVVIPVGDVTLENQRVYTVFATGAPNPPEGTAGFGFLITVDN